MVAAPEHGSPRRNQDKESTCPPDEDLEALLGTLSPDYRERILAGVIRYLIILRGSDPQIADCLEKYGLDLKGVSRSADEAKLRELASGINDPAAFMEEANRRLVDASSELFKGLMTRGGGPGDDALRNRVPPKPRRQMTAEERERAEELRRQLSQPPRLEDLEITGDTATGNAVKGGDLFRSATPVTFVKLGDSWYIDSSIE